MSNDRAPVCNLPNIGQVPALMPGRLYSTIPKAQDLPSLIQATNALAQIVNQLTQPGLAPFNNNLAPVSRQSAIAGTPGIVATAGADGSGGHAGKDGKDGKEAQDPKYKETERKTERVKVKGTESNEDSYLILRRVNHLTMTASADGQKKIVWQGRPDEVFSGPISENRITTVLNAGEGRPFTGTDKFDRETTEENPVFPSESAHAVGTAEKPFEVGLMSDCVGVSWGGSVGFLFVSSNGVYTSKTGEEWGRVAEGFSANAVAYGRKVWVAATDRGMMISKDKGKTWDSAGGPSCQQLVFAGPWVEDDDGKKEDTGAFYALDLTGDSVEGGDVYSSVDGKSWGKILSIPELNTFDESGVAGYTAESLGAQGSTAVLTADQWNSVFDPPHSFIYTVAAKYEGTGGSLGGPSNYGFGSEFISSTGAGVAPGFIAYLKSVNDGVGSQDSDIVVNGGSVISSHLTVSDGVTVGNDVNGGAPMAAANNQAWFFGNEIIFTPDTIQYFLMDGSGGGRHNIGTRVPLSDAANLTTPGVVAALPSHNKRGTSFCATTGGATKALLANVSGHGWTEVFSSGGAVGAGKIANGKKTTG